MPNTKDIYKYLDKYDVRKSSESNIYNGTGTGTDNVVSMLANADNATNHGLISGGMYLQINYNTLQSAYNHPNAKLVIDSMEKCKQTTTYHRDGKSTKTCIDSLYDHYNSNPTFDKESLKQFFEYNDKLDSVRNVRLIDFIPELEECRAFITKS